MKRRKGRTVGLVLVVHYGGSSSPGRWLTSRCTQFAPGAIFQVKCISIVEVLAVAEVVVEPSEHDQPFPDIRLRVEGVVIMIAYLI